MAKIHAELDKTPEERSAVRLTERQLEQLIKVLGEDLPKMPSGRPELPELTHLLDEARAAHARPTRTDSRSTGSSFSAMRSTG